MADLYHLAGWTTLRVQGKDRIAWLHNLCTNDVKRLPPGAGCEAFVTDVKGKILAHVVLLVQEDQVLVVTVPGQAEQLLTHWDRYIIREDVQLADVSDQFAWQIIHGADRNEALQEALGAEVALPAEPWQHVTAGFNDDSLLMVDSGPTIADTDWIATPCESLATLQSILAAGGAASLSDEEFLARRVEAGWPLWGVDFDAQNLPQEVARNTAAISFTKGCYLGQETVARLDALGHVNRQLGQVRFLGDAIPKPGAELLRDDKPAGKITSAAWSSKYNSPLALAMLRRGAESPGVELQTQGGEAALVV